MLLVIISPQARDFNADMELEQLPRNNMRTM